MAMPVPVVLLPGSVVEDIEKHPELFVLLQKEADSLGVKKMGNDEGARFG